MQSIWKLLVSSVFAAHLVLAAAWWWLMPGGFAIWHERFWVNRVLPVAVIAVVATSCVFSRTAPS